MSIDENCASSELMLSRLDVRWNRYWMVGDSETLQFSAIVG